jgi:hypothetical protein
VAVAFFGGASPPGIWCSDLSQATAAGHDVSGIWIIHQLFLKPRIELIGQEVDYRLGESSRFDKRRLS